MLKNDLTSANRATIRMDMQEVPGLFRTIQSHAPKQRSVYSALDAVRFLTAFLVMIYHLFFWRNGDVPRDLASQFWRFGWVGVEIFFTLSGLVIALSAQFSTPRKFLIDRIARLAPTIWICATATLLTTLALAIDLDRRQLLMDYLRTIIVLPNGHHIDIVYWTLTVEVSFYALVFLTLLLGSFRRLISIMIIIGLASALFDTLLCLSQFFSSPILDAVAAAAQHHVTRLILLRHGCFFALGVLIWSLKSELRPKHCSLLIAVLFASATLEVWHGAREQLMLVPVLHQSSAAPVIAWCIGIGFIFAARLLPAVKLEPGFNLPVVLRFAGLLTFPIYLLHNNVGVLLEANLAGRGVPPLLAGLLSAAAILACAILITAIAEPPLARSLKGLLNRIASAAPFGGSSELEVEKGRGVVDK